MSPMPQRGFTLIELSIVLVIIGLIVGGVLVGRDLVAAAAIRAQVSQIEQYNTAVRTFQTKYNCLPGDCKNAAALGFAARSGSANSGDGDGTIEGCNNYELVEFGCETSLFWRDLAQAKLISGGSFSSNADGLVSIAAGTQAQYLPQAKMNSKLSILVGGCTNVLYALVCNGINYLFIEYVTSTDITGGYGTPQPLMDFSTRAGGVTPSQGFQIDSKIDDGLPLAGKVVANITGMVFGPPTPGTILGCNHNGGSDPYSTYPLNTAPNMPGCNLRFEMN